MPGSERVPQWLLEKLALGELSAAEADAVRARLAQEPDGSQRLTEIDASNARILESHPPEWMARQIRARLDRRPTAPRARAWQWALALPAAAMVAVVAVRLASRPTTVHPDVTLDDGRLKGLLPSLRVFRQDGDRIQALTSGDGARRGDRVQLGYVAAGHRFGAVVSIDGRAGVTLHWPRDPASPPALQPGGEVLLPFAYELDDAPSFERFVLVASDQPFALEDVLKAARGVSGCDGPLVLPSSITQTSVCVRKVSP